MLFSFFAVSLLKITLYKTYKCQQTEKIMNTKNLSLHEIFFSWNQNQHKSHYRHKKAKEYNNTTPVVGSLQIYSWIW